MARALEPKATKGSAGPVNMSATCASVLSNQKELRQLEGLVLDKRFVDKASGKDLHRPELEQLTSYVREGETVDALRVRAATNARERHVRDLLHASPAG